MMEFASDIDTSNIGKKLAILLIIIGSALHIASKPNDLMAIGIFSYLLIDVMLCYITKRSDA